MPQQHFSRHYLPFKLFWEDAYMIEFKSLFPVAAEMRNKSNLVRTCVSCSAEPGPSILADSVSHVSVDVGFLHQTS